MGGAFGLAMCNAILNNVLQARLPTSLSQDVRDQIVHGLSANLPGTIDAATQNAVFEAYYQAIHFIFLSFVPIVGLCLVRRQRVEHVCMR